MHVSPEMRHLYWSAFIFNIGQAMVLLFEPVYLFENGYSLIWVSIFYAVMYGVYVLVIPFGAAWAEKYGYERSMFVSGIVYIGYFLALILLPDHPWLFWAVIGLGVIQKMFYWPAYGAFFARYVNVKEKGKEVSVIYSMMAVVFVIGPAISGVMIHYFGFSVMFAIAAIIMLASNIPLIVNIHSFKPYAYGFKEHWRTFLSGPFRRKLVAMTGYGEELIALSLWPVFISIFFEDKMNFGFLITGSAFVTAIIAMVVGKYTDSKSPASVLEDGGILYSASWIARIFVNNPFAAFISDIWSRVSKEMIDVPLNAMIFDEAHHDIKKGSVIQTVAVHEAALAFGKFAAGTVCAALLWILPESIQWQVVFGVATVFSLLYFKYKTAQPV